MIKQIDVLVIHPIWILAFLLGYFVAGYVLVKTANIWAAAFTIFVWFVSMTIVIQYYYIGF